MNPPSFAPWAGQLNAVERPRCPPSFSRIAAGFLSQFAQRTNSGSRVAARVTTGADLARAYTALYETTSPAVILGGFGINEPRLFCFSQSAAFRLDSSSLA